jgi:chemotaxis protein CheX
MMNSNVAVVAYRANVVQVVDMVFSTMIGVNAEPCPFPTVRPADLITAAVYFAGSWSGAVLLECSRRQAFAFAAGLMSIELAAVSDDDARDALGELANMIAGNLKAVMAPGVALSMPTVILGSDYSVQICGKRSAEHVNLWVMGESFGVTLVDLLEPA